VEGVINMLKFMRNHWYDVCGVLAMLSTILFFVFLKQLDTLRMLVSLNFIVILVHQFEEYRFPGGGQAIANCLRRGEFVYDRYPLNQNNAMCGNLFTAFMMYLIPVFFPNVLWLGIVPAVFGLMQLIPHTIIGPVNLKTLYTPGFASTVFGHTPIGIYYLYYIISNNLVVTQDWIIAAVYLAVFMGVFYQGLFYKIMVDKNSKYPFPDKELNRFHMLDKLRARGKI
jgi:hypothetical protein